MKKTFLLFAAVLICSFTTIYAAGGAAPCLATCFLGDTRIGLYMNDGKPIETEDWIVFGGNIVGGLIGDVIHVGFPLGSLYGGYDAYKKSQEPLGFCMGAIWGRRSGSEIKTTKLRTKEILMCIPIIDIYPCIAVPLEAYSGKTMTQVIQEENLKK